MTRIGVLSDTHDEDDAIEAAIRLFEKEECRCIFHVGDFVNATSLGKCKPLRDDIRFYWIHGCPNRKSVHDDFDSLKAKSDEILGVALSNPQESFGTYLSEQLGLSFGLCHSAYDNGGVYDGTTVINRWCKSNEFDFVFYGHFHSFDLRFNLTYQPSNEALIPSTASKAVVINPGCFHKKYRPWTVSILDLKTKVVELYIEHNSAFGKAVSIGLNDRRAEQGECFMQFQHAAKQLREKEKRPGKQVGTHYTDVNRKYFLGLERDSWIDFDRLLRGEAIV